MSSNFGIDFGNEFFLISLPRNGGIDVLLNESSKRMSPTVFGLDSNRIYFGDSALTQQMMNLEQTITNIKRLIGLPYDSYHRI